MQAEFQLSVCPHDTAEHVADWFQFNTYLQRRLNCTIHFEPRDSFILEQTAVLSGGFHITYANPLSACTYIKELGFIPVARPVNLYDETVLVGRRGCGIPEKRPLTVRSASGELINHALGLSLLDRLKVPHGDCRFDYVDTHLKSLHGILKGEADLAFVFNDTWNNISAGARKELEAIAQTDDQIAFHCVLIAPEWAHRKEEIQDLLVNMKTDSKGKLILVSLDLEGFEPLTEDAMDTLQTLMVYYSAVYNAD
jgi:phosphonate transport system substrate-binding protein